MILLLLIWQYLWCRINRGNITNSGGRVGITNTTFQLCSKGAGGRLSELPILSPNQSCHTGAVRWARDTLAAAFSHQHTDLLGVQVAHRFIFSYKLSMFVTGLDLKMSMTEFLKCWSDCGTSKNTSSSEVLNGKSLKTWKMGPEALWSLNGPWEEKRTWARNEWKGPAFLGSPLFSFASLCKYHLPTCSPAFFNFLLKHMYGKQHIPESKRSVRFQTEPYVSTQAGSQVTAGLGGPPRAPCVTSERDSHPDPWTGIACIFVAV